MNCRDINNSVNNESNSISCPFPSVLDWDEPLTDQELEAIDAIEAAFESSPSSTTIAKNSSSAVKKRHSSVQNDQDLRKARRQLPNSVLGLSKPFSLAPCQADVRMTYPAMKFGGRILYSRTPVEVENAARELLQSLEAKKGDMSLVPIGFDIEWKPTFQRGVLPGKAAVLQMCEDASYCHVMHIIHSGVTQSLQVLLEDSTLVKVGVGIRNDCVKIFKEYNVSVQAVEDLSYLANQKLGETKNWSLGSLTEILFCKELQKPKKIRLGNWEVDVLSKAQLQYAATDAFVSWHIYQVLKSLPDANYAVDKRSEELKVVPR